MTFKEIGDRNQTEENPLVIRKEKFYWKIYQRLYESSKWARWTKGGSSRCKEHVGIKGVGKKGPVARKKVRVLCQATLQKKAQ